MCLHVGKARTCPCGFAAEIQKYAHIKLQALNILCKLLCIVGYAEAFTNKMHNKMDFFFLLNICYLNIPKIEHLSNKTKAQILFNKYVDFLIPHFPGWFHRLRETKL